VAPGHVLAQFEAEPWTPRRLKIAAAPCSMRRAKSNLVVSRSPVAIGMVVRRATSASAFMFSGGQGSSYQSGSNFSRRRAIRSAPAAVICPCVPMMMSQAVPTSSRMAPMTRSAVSAADRENWSGTFWPRSGLDRLEGR
jgi:hypothetical protein